MYNLRIYFKKDWCIFLDTKLMVTHLGAFRRFIIVVIYCLREKDTSISEARTIQYRVLSISQYGIVAFRDFSARSQDRGYR